MEFRKIVHPTHAQIGTIEIIVGYLVIQLRSCVGIPPNNFGDTTAVFYNNTQLVEGIEQLPSGHEAADWLVCFIWIIRHCTRSLLQVTTALYSRSCIISNCRFSSDIVMVEERHTDPTPLVPASACGLPAIFQGICESRPLYS